MPNVRWLVVIAVVGCGGAPAPTTATTTPENHQATPPAQPEAPGCRQVIARVMDHAAHGADQQNGALLARMVEPMTGACVDDQWSPALLHCLDTATNEGETGKCQTLMTPAQSEHLSQRLAQALQDSPLADPPAPPPVAPAAIVTGAGIPPECVAYSDAIDALVHCDKMPKEARESMKQAFAQASAGWANLPADAQAQLAIACKQGADAVRQSVAACK